MKYGKCGLCLNVKDLVDSHAMPESAFRLILKEGSGKMIQVTDLGATESGAPPDTGGQYIFCSCCERNLNQNYDQYGIGVLKGQNGTSSRLVDGVRFTDINTKRLRMFVLSTLWRISMSKHPFFQQVQLSQTLESELYQHVKNQTFLPRGRILVGFCRLRNRKNSIDFSMDDLRNMVFAPFITPYQSVMFIMYGFAFECFVGKIKSKRLKPSGILGSSKATYLSRYVEFSEIPEVAYTLHSSLEIENAKKS